MNLRPDGIIHIPEYRNMKIAVICNIDSVAFPSLNWLVQKGYLAGVGVLERNRKHLGSPLLQLGIPAGKIRYFKKQNWEEQKIQWLKELEADMVWVFGFPWKFSQELLAVPAKGFYNFHYGLFPKYKGADPIFWQVKNKEEKAGFVIHQVTEDIDGGPVVWSEEMPVVPGENYGLFSYRMGMITTGILDKLLDAINAAVPVVQEAATGTDTFFFRPDAAETSISWNNQSADEIEWLINACNPPYGGASTWLRGQQVKILEVTPADVNDAAEVTPGTIVYADAVYGLVVACREKKFLRINIVSMREGYMSGVRLFSLGIKAGERFYDNNETNPPEQVAEARSL